MSTETCKTPSKVPTVPKQTRPRMVVVNFRVPAEVKERGYAKAEEEGRNPTEIMRELWTAWTNEGDE